MLDGSLLVETIRRHRQVDREDGELRTKVCGFPFVRCGSGVDGGGNEIWKGRRSVIGGVERERADGILGELYFFISSHTR